MPPTHYHNLSTRFQDISPWLWANSFYLQGLANWWAFYLNCLCCPWPVSPSYIIKSSSLHYSHHQASSKPSPGTIPGHHPHCLVVTIISCVQSVSSVAGYTPSHSGVYYNIDKGYDSQVASVLQCHQFSSPILNISVKFPLVLLFHSV